MNQTNFLFLLGGADLEMVEIKRLLTAHALALGKSDNNLELRWGAKLSNYQNLFNDTQTFVGIELVQDIDPPPHYINIDHHNENSDRTSSLEQVIELLENDLKLKTEFTRDRQLIAANDKGYIPAMDRLGATPEEIADIRRRDREAQGVTDEDEQLAERSIRDHLTTKEKITVVKSLTSKFSTITDRLYPCTKLLIYTDDELTYYGEGISQLTTAFDELIKQQKAYYGGGKNGFFGIGSKKLTIDELQELKNMVISIQSHQT